MNIHAAAAFASHLLTARSTAGHGVHSPLMFRFITEVIGGRADKDIIEEVRNLRKEMLTDSRIVRVTDLGAGSRLMRGRERSIRQIASSSALPAREVALLARIAARLDKILQRVPGQQAGGPQAGDPLAGGPKAGDPQAGDPLAVGPLATRRMEKDCEPVVLTAHGHRQGDQPENDDEPNSRKAHGGEPASRPAILELGTSLGISTLALALAAPDRRVITVEGCPELAATARENLRRHGAANAEVLNMEFSQALTHLRTQGTRINMAFIDGNHRGAALTDYTLRIRELGDEIIIVADDIHISADMIHAWRSLAGGTVSGLQPAGPVTQTPEQLQPAGPVIQTPEQLKPAGSQSPVSLETFRLGILFCLRNLTPGRYRIRY